MFLIGGVGERPGVNRVVSGIATECFYDLARASSPHRRLLGRTRVLLSWLYNDAKLILNDFAVRPFVLDLMNSRWI
jgi:hypothetical protein